jgi:lysophospholipase L1-like esterase
VRDGIFGLGGVAFETEYANATAWAGTAEEGTTGRTVSVYDISYLAQPKGGSFDVLVNDKVVTTVSTRADERRAAHRLLEVPPGESRLTVKTRGDGRVRIFGAVLESGKPGVVYDSLAINGVRIGLFNRFNAKHWRDELRYRNANLVIMMCGANEGANDMLALGMYRQQLGGVLQTIQNAVPDAGCLIVGPLDQAERGEDGELTSKRMPRKLTRAQREVALSQGCAFFDTYEAMGGKNSMAAWYKRGLAGADFIHPTEHGARKIGRWLAEAILAGYENYIFNGEQCESSVTFL